MSDLIIQATQSVVDWPTKAPAGFTYQELEALLAQYPTADTKKFWDSLRGQTGIIADGEFVTYRDDVEKALIHSLIKTRLKAPM